MPTPASAPLQSVVGICLSNDVRRSDVCAFVPISAQNQQRVDLIERCRTFPDPVLVHIPRAALLSDAMGHLRLHPDLFQDL